MEEGYPGYADGLKRQLVEDRIEEQYGLEAKGEEMNEFAKRYIADQFMQYGMPVPEGEDLQRMRRPDAGRSRTVRAHARHHRGAEAHGPLQGAAEPQRAKLSYEEFVNLARTA